jgi:hypothetical protein
MPDQIPTILPRRLRDVSDIPWTQLQLPYGMKLEHIQRAMRFVYSILDDMSQPLVARGIGRVEDFMLGNSLSGLISELLVRQLAQTTGMKRNVLVGGFPDLLPTHYPGNAYQDAREGIEAKTTIQPRKLEAHHQFVGDFLLFQYFADLADPQQTAVESRWPLEFYGVVFGRIADKSWWNKVSVGKTRKKTQNTTLKAEFLSSILASGTLFRHPDRDLFLRRMEANRQQRKQRAQGAGPELETEDLSPTEEDTTPEDGE